MPLAMLLRIAQPERNYHHAKVLRAIAFAIIEAGDAPLAAELHNQTGEKPFTVAAVPGALGWLRLTALNDDTQHALLGAAALLEREGRLASRAVDLTIDRVVCSQPPMAQQAGYAALAAAPFRAHAALRFATPTTFSQGGDLHLPLPVPELILKSWARRWNAWSDRPPVSEPTLARLIRCVGLARAEIGTETTAVKGGKAVGFTGAVVLEALDHGAWPPEDRAAFAGLVAFSRFCGTGARTTQGLGLTLPGEEG